MGIIQSIFLFLRAFIMGRAAAAVENLALRQQVEAAFPGPHVLGSAFPPLGKLAFGPGHCATRDGRPMAPEGFPIVLETEIDARQTWATAHRTEDK